jgi:hypothetical protein
MLLMTAVMQKTDDGHRKCSYIVEKNKKRNVPFVAALVVAPDAPSAIDEPWV